MRDWAAHAAGILAMVIAFVHGALGETQVFKHTRMEPARYRLLIRLAWQNGAVAWFMGGVLLFTIPWMESEIARRWIAGAMAVVYGSAALGNAWSSKGRHFGWIVLALVTVLALASV